MYATRPKLLTPYRGYLAAATLLFVAGILPVSYTHLDVYKRQVHALWIIIIALSNICIVFPDIATMLAPLPAKPSMITVISPSCCFS